MNPLLRGAAALLLAFLEPELPFDAPVREPVLALAFALAVMLTPLLVVGVRPARVRSLVAVLGFAALLVVGGWADLVERSRLGAAPLVGETLLFAPYFVAEAAAVLGELRLSRGAFRDVALVYGTVRSTLVATALPVASYALFGVYLMLFHLFTQIGFWLGAFPSLSVPLAASYLALGFCFAPLAVPPLLAASPLPAGRLRDRLERVASGAGFRAREIFRWAAGGAAANAFVVGIAPRWRAVFLSETLVRGLAEEEVAAVYAHEIAHVRRRHFWAYAGLGFAFLLFPAVVEATFPGVGVDGASAGGLAANVGLALAYWGGLFPWTSRRLERDADLFAAAREPAFPRALEKVAAINGIDVERAGVRHFSVARRLRDLGRARAGTLPEHRREIVLLVAGIASLVGAGVVALATTLPSEIRAGKGRLALARGDLREAERQLRAALARDPDDPRLGLDLGRTLFRAGEAGEGLERIRRAHAAGGGDATTAATIATEFWEVGERSIATALVEEFRWKSLATRGSRRDLARLLATAAAMRPEG